MTDKDFADRWIKESKKSQLSRKDNYRKMPFKDYLNLVKENPTLAQNAHARLLEVIKNRGVEDMFGKRLFGLDKSIEEVVRFIEGGAKGSSTGKQILLLVSPPGGGKSTFVNILKQSLERHFHDKGEVFRVTGCPINEEPLHLLPRAKREEVSRKLGIKVEGDLCPVCRHNLRTNYKDKDGTNRWWEVEVETFRFSIQKGVGIGSYEPTEDKTASVADLVGHENVGITARGDGYKDPRAFTLDGELLKANRGIFEGRELLKAQEELLWVFISAAEEKEIKVQGSPFPHISLDAVLLGHTNLTKYKKFAGNNENEALHNRIYVVAFPYPLKIKDEVKVYRKLIEEESNFRKLNKCHIAPGVLELAALFAILTRLSKSPIDELRKAKLYNGDRVLTDLRGKDIEPVDVDALMKEGQKSTDLSEREGMRGVSSRDILAALNDAIVKHGNGCLTLSRFVKVLSEVFNHRMGYTEEEISRFKTLISAEKGSVVEECYDLIEKAVKKAFLRTYGDLARQQYDRYVKEVVFYREPKRKYVSGPVKPKQDDLTGKAKKPDVEFMRSVEKVMNLDEAAAEVFRGELLETMAVGGGSYQNPIVMEAVETKLFLESKGILKTILTSDALKGKEEHERAKDLFQGLMEDNFCEICAKDALEQASNLF